MARNESIDLIDLSSPTVDPDTQPEVVEVLSPNTMSTLVADDSPEDDAVLTEHHGVGSFDYEGATSRLR